MISGIGKRIRLARELAKLNQKELAELCEVKAQTVSKWELEIIDINISTINKLSEVLGVSEGFLLAIEDVNSSQENTLQETAAEYGPNSSIKLEFMKKEILYLNECRTKLLKQVEIQEKLIDAYESGFVPKNMSKSTRKEAVSQKHHS